jgi:hypothetical protein
MPRRTEARLADRLAALMLEGVNQAARVPAGLPLFAARKTPGLFPTTAAGRQAADEACHLGLIRRDSAVDPELFIITERGLAYFLEESTPRQVLDDVARAIESRGEQLDTIAKQTVALQMEWQGLRRLMEGLSARLDQSRSALLNDGLDELRDVLRDWRASGDCPLPELYSRWSAKHPGGSIGRFHDHLRRLHDDDAIYLHPWTGPLYTLPEPAFALLVGHEVAYYASLRSDKQFEQSHKRLAISDKPNEKLDQVRPQRTAAVA